MKLVLKLTPFVFALFIANTANAQVTIGGKLFVPMTHFGVTQDTADIEYVSTLSDGKFTVQEKNLCPQTYKGGVLWANFVNQSSLINAVVMNGEILVQVTGNPTIVGVNLTTTGTPIGGGIISQYREFGQTKTYSNLFAPSVYLFQMRCDYLDGCEELGPDINGCSFAPSKWYGINLAPPKKLNLSIAESAITANPSKPTADGKFSVSPNVPTTIYVNVSGSDFNSPENRNTTVSLQIGTRPLLQKIVPLSAIAATGSYQVPFDVTFTVSEMGPVSIQAFVNQSGILPETNLDDNTRTQKLYALCNVEDKGTIVNYFSQGGQSPWADDDYANQGPIKMRKLGCYTSSFAMLMDAYGIKKSADGFSPINPGSVNIGLSLIGYFSELGPSYSQYTGYNPKGAVEPIGAVNFARASYAKNCILAGNLPSECHQKASGKISYVGRTDTFSVDDQFKLNQQLCAGNPVILKVRSLTYPNNLEKAHFVLAKALTVRPNGELFYESYDPARRAEGNSFFYKLNEPRGFRLYRQISDPSMISIHLSGGLNMIVTDPMGNKVGYDPYTQQFYNTISNATYTLPESIDSPEGDVSTGLEATFESVAAIDGQYQVQIFGDPNINKNFSLLRYSFDSNGKINAITEKNETILAGQSKDATFTHSSESLPVRYSNLSISRALFFDSVKKDKALITGQITPEDGHAISTIEKFVTVRIGTFVKSVELKAMKKIKLKKDTYYMHLDFGKKGLAFEINADTGDFAIYIDNIDLDDSKPTLTTNIEIQIDDIKAENMVTFNDVKRRKNGK